MISQRDSLYIRAAWGFIIVFTIVRLIYSGFFLLTPDEANHWQWGRHLAWGYHDQAPMTGWIIRFSTFIIGQTETGVRLPSVLAMTAVSGYMLLIALKWIGPKAAFNTAILANSILVFNVGGLLATPDSLQAVAWAGASYHVACAYEKGAWFQWLMGGCVVWIRYVEQIYHGDISTWCPRFRSFIPKSSESPDKCSPLDGCYPGNPYVFSGDLLECC